MHISIRQVNVHFHPLPTIAGAFVSALAEHASASNDEGVKSNATIQTVPRIGDIWAGQGGIYLGTARGLDGAPDQHKVMAIEMPDGEVNHKDAHTWAAALEVDGHKDFHVATRQEGSLICANAQDKVDITRCHWLSEQYSDISAYVQDFYDGYQSLTSVTAERPVRAVRSFDV